MSLETGNESESSENEFTQLFGERTEEQRQRATEGMQAMFDQVENTLEQGSSQYDQYSTLDERVKQELLVRSFGELIDSAIQQVSTELSDDAIRELADDAALQFFESEMDAYNERRDHYEDDLSMLYLDEEGLGNALIDEVIQDHDIDRELIHPDWMQELLADYVSQINNGQIEIWDAMTLIGFDLNDKIEKAEGTAFLTQSIDRNRRMGERLLQEMNQNGEEYLALLRQSQQEAEQTEIVGTAEQFTEEDLTRAAYLEQNILNTQNPESELTVEDALLLAQTTTNPQVLAIVMQVPGSTDITRAVITNLTVTYEILVSIANSQNLDERIELALNTDNKEVLIMLCSDVDELKLFIATERIEHPDYGELAEELFWSTIGTENIQEPIETNIIANLLFRSTNHGNVENLVIDHMSELPTEILVLLAEVSTNRDALDRLAASTTDWEILRNIIGNRSTPLETQQAILSGELDRTGN